MSRSGAYLCFSQALLGWFGVHDKSYVEFGVEDGTFFFHMLGARLDGCPLQDLSATHGTFAKCLVGQD
jgi:hypothetical protein